MLTEPLHLFRINPDVDTPIYQQLMDQARRLMAAGELRAGDKLPPVRKLAARLAINPMTVSKAYSQLVAAGWLTRLRGQGVVAAPRHDHAETEAARLTLLVPAVQELAAQAIELRLPANRVATLLEQQIAAED